MKQCSSSSIVGIVANPASGRDIRRLTSKALDREPERVLADVVSGIISPARAKEVYGVVIRVVDEQLEQYEIDDTATEEFRRALRLHA